MNFPGAYFIFEEAVDVERALGVDAIHHAERVERNSEAVEHLGRCEHSIECGLTVFGHAITVVKLLRTVDAEAHEETVLL